MTDGNADRNAVLAKLAAFSRLIAARDMAILEELSNPLGFLLLGSEAGERAANREELTTLLQALFAKPYSLRFDWPNPEVTIQGEVAWVTADGVMRVVEPGRERAMPYRMVGVLHKQEGGWAWRLFSGSEPAPPPPE